ncbi:MAG: hypothetical protein ACOY32_11000 [Thermodesulfobacteriota bacterium]
MANFRDGDAIKKETVMQDAAVPISEKLHTLHRFTEEKLTGFLQQGDFAGYGIKANEFDVFCAFWVIACYLRSTATPAAAAVEVFSRSAILAIVDRIAADREDDVDDDTISNSLSDAITTIFMERFSAYRESFGIDVGKVEVEVGPAFPSLVSDFFANVLDRPLAQNAPARQVLGALLADFLSKSRCFFVG